MTERDTDKYVTAERAATTLGVSERTIYRYAETGQLRTRKSGRRTMFHAGDVDSLASDMQAQRQGPDPDEVARLRQDIEAANYRIGYLQSQLDQRLLPDHARQMQVTNPPGRPTVTENGGNISTIPAAKNRDFAGSIVGVSGRYIDEAERDMLRQQLSQAAAPWRTWLLIGLIIIVAILATLLVSVFVFGGK